MSAYHCHTSNQGTNLIINSGIIFFVHRDRINGTIQTKIRINNLKKEKECAFSPKTHSINLKLTRLLKQRVCKIVSMSKTHSISIH